MTTDEFSRLIKDKRTKLNLTQKQLANLLNVSNKTISRWENCRGYPDIETLPKLAQVLELSYDELLGGNEYILMKRKDKKRIRKTVSAIILLFSLIIAIGFYRKSQGFHSNYYCRDLLASKDLLNCKMSLEYKLNNISESYWYYRYDEIRRSKLLEMIDLDYLIETNNQEKEIFMNNYNDGNYSENDYLKLDFNANYEDLLSLTIYLFDDKSYFYFSNTTKIRGDYIYEDTFDHKENKLYYLDYKLTIDTDIFNDMKNEFDYCHQIKNTTTILKELTKDEIIALIKRTDIYDYNIAEGLYVEDKNTGKQYYIIKSNVKDYTSIDAINDQGTLKVKCQANNKIYFKPYLHMFEITEPIDTCIFEVNGKEVIPNYGININW